jgi:hypothetical protein
MKGPSQVSVKIMEGGSEWGKPAKKQNPSLQLLTVIPVQKPALERIFESCILSREYNRAFGVNNLSAEAFFVEALR